MYGDTSESQATVQAQGESVLTKEGSMPFASKPDKLPEKKGAIGSPLYSSGTKDMDSKENQGPVAGPKGEKSTPDPLGYKD